LLIGITGGHGGQRGVPLWIKIFMTPPLAFLAVPSAHLCLGSSINIHYAIGKRGGVSQKPTKPDKGKAGQPITDKVDSLLNKKLLLCNEEPDKGEGGQPKTDKT